MAIQKALKSYPMTKWFLIASGVLVVAGLLASGIVTDPNSGHKSLFIYFIVGAVILPFLSLAFPRREVVVMELPTDHLANATRQELQGMLDSLEQGKQKGELTQDRYNKARDRIVAAMKDKK